MSYLNLKPVLYIINFFTKGHERSIKAKKNIISSLMLKGISICISLITVPITLNYVNASRLGIWLTLSSIVAWFAFFDIGLTLGLRNKLAEAKAKGDDSIARVYISTTYALLFIIFVSIWLLFLFCNNFLNWSKILNVSESMHSEVSTLAVIVFTYFCMFLVLRIINAVLFADQKPAMSSFFDLLGQVLSLIFIIILVKTTEGSLIKLGIAYCVPPLLVLVGSNLILFNSIYKKYRPAISQVRFSCANELFKLGIMFFIIQFAVVVQNQTANIIIARNFSTADVTSYNIVFRYFGILTMVFNIFLIPFWSASTEAYQKNDIQWIRNGMKKYNQLNVVMILIGCLMLAISSTVYRLWLGEGKVNIDFSLSLFGFLFFNTSMFGGKYVIFLNGISALRIQFIACIISPLLYIVLALFLIRYFRMGVYALFIASIIANFNTIFLAPIQYHQIIKNGKKGIWIK